MVAGYERVETVSRRVAVLDSPAPASAVEFWMNSFARQIREAGRTVYDDTITIEAYDDEIHISYEMKDND